MKTLDQIHAAIASLDAEIARLEKLGTEKGSVQTYRGKHHRLAWWENGRVRNSPKLDPASVPQYKAAHERWRKCRALRRKKEKLEQWIYETAAIAIAS